MKISVHLIPIPPPQLASTCSLPDQLFHYTTVLKLKQIINSGVIKPSTSGIEPTEKPVVWCSTSLTWEPTATKCPVPGKPGQLITANAQGGLARIKVPATCAPHDVRQLHELAGTSISTCLGLLYGGLELGSDPDTWRFSLDAIPSVLFQSVELFDFQQDAWREIDLAELACRN